MINLIDFHETKVALAKNYSFTLILIIDSNKNTFFLISIEFFVFSGKKFGNIVIPQKNELLQTSSSLFFYYSTKNCKCNLDFIRQSRSKMNRLLSSKIFLILWKKISQRKQKLKRQKALLKEKLMPFVEKKSFFLFNIAKIIS